MADLSNRMSALKGLQCPQKIEAVILQSFQAGQMKRGASQMSRVSAIVLMYHIPLCMGVELLPMSVSVLYIDSFVSSHK